MSGARGLILASLLIAVGLSSAGCGPALPDDAPAIAAPASAADGDPLALPGLAVDGTLIAVHPSRTWDPLALAAPAIARALAQWVERGHPSYLLRHDDAQLFNRDGRRWSYRGGAWTYGNATEGGIRYPDDVDSYYVTPAAETVVVPSEDGEHPIRPDDARLTFVGGYLNGCLAHAVGWSVANHIASGDAAALRITIYLPAVFTFRGAPATELADDIREQWPYPVNPGFVRLHQQVGIAQGCPTLAEVNNEMVHMGGDYPALGGAPTPPDLTVSLACDGAGIGSLTLGQGSVRDVSINFIVGR